MRFGLIPAAGCGISRYRPRTCLPQLRAATDPNASGGQFYGPLLVNNGPPVTRPILRRLWMDEAIERLWTVSEQATGLALDVDGDTHRSRGTPRLSASQLDASVN